MLGFDRKWIRLIYFCHPHILFREILQRGSSRLQIEIIYITSVKGIHNRIHNKNQYF